MSENQKSISWEGLIIEAGVIIISILLAFGIDAWWNDRQEIEEEAIILSVLMGEMSMNLVRLENEKAYHAASQTTGFEILKIVGKAQHMMSMEDVDKSIADLSWWSGSNKWETGVLDSLILGGKLSVIRNEDIRRKIVELNKKIGETRLIQAQDYDFYLTVFLPYMREHGSLPQISDALTIRPGTQEAYVNIPDKYNFDKTLFDHRPLIVSREFQNLVLHKVWIQGDILAIFISFSEEMVALISEIETELKAVSG
jgi:hypothetical protein